MGDAQDRAERRLFAPGNVAVPDFGYLRLIGRTFEGDDLRLVVTRCKSRKTGKGVFFKRSKAPTKGEMLLAVDSLIAEENHLVGNKRLLDLGDLQIAERF